MKIYKDSLKYLILSGSTRAVIVKVAILIAICVFFCFYNSKKTIITKACIIRIDTLPSKSQKAVYYRYYIKHMERSQESLGKEYVDTTISNYYKIGDTLQIEASYSSSPPFESHILNGQQ